MVLLLAAACTAPTETPGQTSIGDQTQTSPSFVQVPQGFEVSLFAEGLPGVRMLELGPNDRLYAVLSSAGDVVRFDLNADGTASGVPTTVVSGLRQPYGLAFRGGDLYVGETHQVIRLTAPGFTQETVVVPGLPAGGERGDRGLCYRPYGYPRFGFQVPRGYFEPYRFNDVLPQLWRRRMDSGLAIGPGGPHQQEGSLPGAIPPYHPQPLPGRHFGRGRHE